MTWTIRFWLKQTVFLYHFAVVVDDHLMNITHIVKEMVVLQLRSIYFIWRHLVGKNLHLFILEAVLNKSGKKLSKKKWWHASVEDFRLKVICQKALINYLALVGWVQKQWRNFIGSENDVAIFFWKSFKIRRKFLTLINLTG